MRTITTIYAVTTFVNVCTTLSAASQNMIILSFIGTVLTLTSLFLYIKSTVYENI